MFKFLTTKTLHLFYFKTFLIQGTFKMNLSTFPFYIIRLNLDKLRTFPLTLCIGWLDSTQKSVVSTI